MALSEREKAKIIEEEKLRKEIRDEDNKAEDTIEAIFSFILVGGALFGVYMALSWKGII